jgi:hypothetical protein
MAPDDKKGIPPDPYPIGVAGVYFAGTTDFDRPLGSPHTASAEIRGEEGQDVISLHVSVVPPRNGSKVFLSHVNFNVVNASQPQIAVGIQSVDGNPIKGRFKCQFSFLSTKRP